MASLNQLTVKITGESSSFERAAASARKSIEDLESTVKRVGASLSATLSLPLAGIATLAVKSAAEMDSLKRGLTAVAGSSAEASAQLERLKKVAELPGLGFREAVQGSINLQAAGFSAETAERALKAFGNALATVGKGKADLQGVILALSQIQSKGKISAEEINQLAERLPQIRVALKDAFGTADTEAISKLGVSSKEFVERVIREFEKIKPVTGGIQNAFENLSDSVTSTLARIGQSLLPFVESAVSVLTSLLTKVSDVADGFQKLSPAVQSAFIGFAGATAAAGPIALLAARMGLLEGAGASAAAVLTGPQGIIVAMGIGLATAAVAAAADIVRLNDVLDKFFDQQEKLAQGKQAKGIADLFSNPNGTAQTINQLKAAAAASEEARSQFRGFGKGISTDLQKQLGDINVRALGSATEELDRAFRILGAKTTKDFNRELSNLKDAMETVRGQFKAGETDIGALNRATEAYSKKLKELGIESSKAKPLASLFNLGEQEISNRFQAGLQAAAKAVADFILASEPIGTKLPLETAKLGDAYFAVAERIDSSGNRVRSQIVALTDEVDILRQKFSDLNKVARIDVEINQGKSINVPVNETGAILNRSGQQSQVQLRESARQAGDDLQRIVELRDKGQATQADVLRAQQIYSEAEQRAAGITIQTTRTRISNFQQLTQSIRRSIESISDGIIDVISGAQSIGEVFRGIALNISQSILKYVINEGLALMGKELAKLGGLLGSLGRQLASIFGNSSAVASAAGTVASTAGSAGSAAGSAAGGAASAATGIVSGGVLGAVGAISSAVSAVFAGLQFFQGRRMEQDIGRIEVTSRSILNEVSNVRRDMQAQFDGTFARLGDVWNTLQHIDEGLSGIPFSSSGFKSAQGVTIAGDVVVNDPVGNVDDLMAGISRRLKAKDRAFAAA